MLYRATGSITAAFWIGVLLNLVCFVFIIVLNCIDKANENRRKHIRYVRRAQYLRDKVAKNISEQSRGRKSNTKFSILDDSEAESQMSAYQE
mmetsp:Transcript_47639/g.34906  ORF Transcript_47639/g.34906 Transcript_47639/m.34906 type:complete len:92 (-) Transcript_47639:658-933(-)